MDTDGRETDVGSGEMDTDGRETDMDGREMDTDGREIDTDGRETNMDEKQGRGVGQRLHNWVEAGTLKSYKLSPNGGGDICMYPSWYQLRI